ncbi:MAG: hypothetical protein V4489_04370 [Chlamydiota bacterium]
MRIFFVVVMVFLSMGKASAGTPEYWLIQQDFIKMGTRELYETQKLLELKKQSYQIIGAADLVDPEFLFLMPVEKLAYLDRYPPFKEQPKEKLLESCINFQIFSLHQLLEKSSLNPMETFLEAKPYYFYAIYEMEPGAGFSLEDIMEKKALSQKKGESWCFWKSLLAGEYPKYIFCTSFATKEEMKEWSMEKIIDEPGLKNVLRGKKTGWMKSQKEFCFR